MADAQVTKAQIISSLKALGFKSGTSLMVHASLKSFGPVEGGAVTVIEALKEIVTPEGTLVMPSFNHGAPFKKGGPGFYHPEQTPTENGGYS